MNFILSNTTPKEPFLEAHAWENIAVILTAGAFFYLLYFLKTHKFWGPRLTQGFKGFIPKLGLGLALFFIGIALLDSFSWKDDYPSDAQVEPAARAPRTLFDRAFSKIVGVPEYKFTEATSAAPLGKTEFLDETKKLKYKHIFGTNAGGQDTFYLVMKGVRTAVFIGTIPLLIMLPIAILLGVSAGFFGGKLDGFVVWIYTMVASIPTLLLLLAIATTFEVNLKNMCIALGLTSWIGLCRLIRGETMKLRELEYIQAAKCLGVPTWKIVQKHILPNLTHIILITCILTFTALVLMESILAYLGVGLKSSWGKMIANAKSEIAQDPVIWWNLVFASLFLFLLVLSVNIVGDAIRNAIDPKATQE